MAHRIIIKLKDSTELKKFRRLIHSKKNKEDCRCWMERSYTRSEWNTRNRPYAAYIVGCTSKNDIFKLAIMFETEKYYL